MEVGAFLFVISMVVVNRADDSSTEVDGMQSSKPQL